MPQGDDDADDWRLSDRSESGDIVAVDGRVGRVVGSENGRPVIAPFPIPGQEGLRRGHVFTAQGRVRVLRRSYEREME